MADKEQRIVSFPLTGYSAHELIERLGRENGDVENIMIAVRWKDGTATTGWSTSEVDHLCFLAKILDMAVEREVRTYGDIYDEDN